jgi:hypothetical protein
MNEVNEQAPVFSFPLHNRQGMLLTATGLFLLRSGLRHIRRSSVLSLAELAAGAFLLVKGVKSYYADELENSLLDAARSNNTAAPQQTVTLDITV